MDKTQELMLLLACKESGIRGREREEFKALALLTMGIDSSDSSEDSEYDQFRTLVEQVETASGGSSSSGDGNGTSSQSTPDSGHRSSELGVSLDEIETAVPKNSKASRVAQIGQWLSTLAAEKERILRERSTTESIASPSRGRAKKMDLEDSQKPSPAMERVQQSAPAPVVHESVPDPTSFNGALQSYTFTPPVGPLPPTKRITRSSAHPSPVAAPPGLISTATPTKRKLPPTASSTSAKKPKRTPSSYAPPSKYAHLTNNLIDVLASNLICIFIGVNPGLETARSGHAYAHPSNLFWKLLHSSGCTPRRCSPSEDRDLPRLYALGNTNIVTRPTKDAAELSKGEMDEGVQVLEEKVAKYRPEAVCIVGKGIWESVWRVRHGKAIRKEEFRYGWQDEGENMGVVNKGKVSWGGAKVFVATTTSGLAAGMRPWEKEEVWRGLGEWVERRRREREGAEREAAREEIKAGEETK